MGRANEHLPYDAEGDSVSLTQEELDNILRSASDHAAAALRLATDLCVIPAPTGDERARAEFVSRALNQRGYGTEIDDIFNVYAHRGSTSGKSLTLLAHTDTVFPAGTALNVTEVDGKVAGPAIGDNCLGVAAMLTSIDILDQLGMPTEAGIRIVANVGEEGLGNLVGAWRAVQRFQDQTAAVIAVEGHNFGRITNVGVGSKRWRVTVRGPGGHSWGAFGEPSAIHGLGRIIAGIAGLQVPENPRTSFNVGMIEGGTSINTIAPVASALIDMRSVDEGELDDLAERVGRIIEAEAGDELSVSVEVLGERPAGSTSVSHPVIEAAAKTLNWLGVEPVYDAASTDANVAISLGIPAFCIGITQGGRVHTTEEFIYTEPIQHGIAQLVRLCLDVTSLTSRQAS